MLALSIRQPYALLVALGLKPVENRPRSVPQHLIGKRVAVHAALPWKEETVRAALAGLIYGGAFDRLEDQTPNKVFVQSETLLGCIIGSVRIARVIHKDDVGEPLNTSPWRTPAEFGYVLADALLLDEPLKMRGQLGFFSMPPAIGDAVLRAERKAGL